MDNARIAAFAAVALAGFAMMVNFLALPMLMTKVAKIHVDLQVGMQSFKVMADQAWDEMMDLRRVYVPRSARDIDYDTSGFAAGAGSGSGDASSVPSLFAQPSGVQSAVDYQQQAWDQFSSASASIAITTGVADAMTSSLFDGVATTTSSGYVPFDNGCPAGPAGPPGEAGKDGLEGPPGLDGLQGQNAEEMKFEDLDMCSICPGGPRGPGGPPGPQGKMGKKGFMGEIGKPGKNGTVGETGSAGERGFQGLPGKPGGKGKKGKPAPGGKGKPGPKGATGPIGRAGPQGPPGNSSLSNNGTGPDGAMGLGGLNGIPGKTGQPGPPGPTGLAGGEGGYCPCPKELNRLGIDTGNGTNAPSLPTTTSSAGAIPPQPAPPSNSGSVATLVEPAPVVSPLDFGGAAPGFGPPGSAQIAGDGSGVVALPPAGGAGDGAQPPGSATHGGNVDASIGSPAVQTGLGDQNGGGGLNNVMQLPVH